MVEDLQVTRSLVIPGQALTVRTARASGPGGQHVNRTETKVHLWLDPDAVPGLSDETRVRLRTLAGQRVDSQGRILISSQEHRDQAQNLAAARARLRELLLRALTKPKRRVATKPTRASQKRRVEAKKARAKTKLTRRKVDEE